MPGNEQNPTPHDPSGLREDKLKDAEVKEKVPEQEKQDEEYDISLFIENLREVNETVDPFVSFRFPGQPNLDEK